MIGRALTALGRALDHPDPLTAAMNTVAAVLAGNTPFYPIYLYVVLGRDATPMILLTLCSLPFWCAVPMLARRSGLAARVFLTVIGVLNTLWCAVVLGFNTGIALFLIPCILLATLGFHRAERRLMLGLTALPFLAYGVLRYAPMGPLMRMSAAAQLDLVTLNGFSVACLCAFLGYRFAGARPTKLP
jgi:hypothetical protein